MNYRKNKPYNNCGNNNSYYTNCRKNKSHDMNCRKNISHDMNCRKHKSTSIVLMHMFGYKICMVRKEQHTKYMRKLHNQHLNGTISCCLMYDITTEEIQACMDVSEVHEYCSPFIVWYTWFKIVCALYFCLPSTVPWRISSDRNYSCWHEHMFIFPVHLAFCAFISADVQNSSITFVVKNMDTLLCMFSSHTYTAV